MKTLIAIYAHLQAKATFERHFQFWEALKQPGDEIMMFCPADAPLQMPGVMSQVFGKAQHHGRNAIDHFRSQMEHMAGLGFDRYAWFEYDSICLGPLPEFVGQMAANFFHDDGKSFTAKIYCHPPLLFTAAGLQAIVKEFQDMPSNSEAGYWDRWLGLAIERTGIIYHDLLGKGEGYSHNTIHESQHKDLYRAVLNGARLIHGIKDEATLEVIKRAWNRRKAVIAAETPDELEK